MANRDLPSVEFLRQCFSLDAETGHLTWRYRDDARLCWNRKMAGKRAGCVSQPSGYRVITIKTGIGRVYLEHRVIWRMVYGVDPIGDVDHINGIPSDNRPANLRDVSRRENLRNCKIAKNNKSGVTGVGWHKSYQKWAAYIQSDDGYVFLGRHDKLEDAIRARREAELMIGFHANHGRAAA